jgi:hypothetical protein
MKVVKEFGEWFGCCTTVPNNVDSSFDNLFTAVPVNDDSSLNNLVAEENREVRPLFSTATMSPISKVHNNDHSMDVDNNGEEELFQQSTHPPSIISSEKRREIRDSFNEDETVFLVNTSFSSVTNHPNDLKVSLSNRIREINALCAHFELDYESLSPDGCSGLDMSIMESIVQDHSDSTYLDWSVSTK